MGYRVQHIESIVVGLQKGERKTGVLLSYPMGLVQGHAKFGTDRNHQTPLPNFQLALLMEAIERAGLARTA
jgi:hypothetical protein